MKKPQKIKVEHLINPRPAADGCDQLKSFAEHPALRQLLEFYKKHNGMQLCRNPSVALDAAVIAVFRNTTFLALVRHVNV